MRHDPYAVLDAAAAERPAPRPAPMPPPNFIEEFEPSNDVGVIDQVATRYKLLSGEDLHDLPSPAYCVRGVLPAVGLAALFGPSGSGKSFLGFDLGAAIPAGNRWFDCRVNPAPVVYLALEGEAGFKLRAQAWEASRGRPLPEGFQMVLQPFKLTDPQDVHDLASVLPAGAVLFIDTLNRAAPAADENSSRDMGAILEAAKLLQSMTGGLVVLVHHTGKDSTRGLRGHSSLLAAMDAAIEVSRDGDRREWRVAKSKDGQDGEVHSFKLRVETLGIDEHGDPITSCVVDRDTAAQDVRTAKLPQGGNQRLVFDALRPLFKNGRAGLPGAPPLRPCIELDAAIAAGAAKLTCPTDRRTSRTREAITGLAARGVIGLHEGWLWLT
ncbi:AAA family ATPase [Variovorax ginsengisoli]|uniref:AAA family ATPase n=1 Tax=Variovorax ginsengisoli TaxID=363844 RepID=A0ABT8S6V6_9BURK|nr:AAA family ATPase [Variovorax ginsengisoli]MDN8615486.1 AAA family ATPase [Variovorax ginsengisoli]MDO1534656.1 AAA family ATPase [Variovorax ginsengisoli]